MYWYKYHIYQNFKKCSKMKNTNSMPLFMPKKSKIFVLLSNFKRPLFKTIFIEHYVMCSSISFYCNHLSSMLMSVKLIVIQWELNGMGYKLIFHSYSKFASNTWYTLICKFLKCKPNPQKNWVWTYIIYWIRKKKN